MWASLLELGVALLWSVYHALESGLMLVLPARLFHKDITGQVGDCSAPLAPVLPQVLLVTGGGSGIGRLMCLRLHYIPYKPGTWPVCQVRQAGGSRGDLGHQQGGQRGDSQHDQEGGIQGGGLHGGYDQQVRRVSMKGSLIRCPPGRTSMPRPGRPRRRSAR